MKYAIVESGGKQYKAVEGDIIEVDRLPVEAGAEVKIEQVLLLLDGDEVTVGTPTVKGVSVKATVVEHVKGPKVIIFHYRPKKRYRVKTGHRQNYTRLRVAQIGESAKPKVRQEPEKEVKPAEAKPKTVKATTAKAKSPAAKKPKATSTKTTKTPATKAGKKKVSK